MKKKRAVIGRECVACGCCMEVCPKSAISIYRGSYARINEELCIGCGLCAKECPAAVISIEGY